MIFLLKHKTAQKESRLKNYGRIGAVLVFAVFIGSLFYFGNSFFSPLFVNIFAPISGFFSKTFRNIELGSEFLKPKSSLVRDNEALRERIAGLEARALNYRLLEEENEILRKNLNFIGGNFMLASILLMPPKTPYDLILIDRGSRDGVEAGVQALMGDRVALGYVEEAFERMSKVRMFSSSGIKTSAVLFRDGTFVELEGRGGGNFFLEVPSGFDIAEGDVFLVPGSKRMIVAVAYKIERAETSSFIKVLLRVPLRVSGDSRLFIETK